MDWLLASDSGRTTDWFADMGIIHGGDMRTGYSERMVCAKALLAGDLRNEDTELLRRMQNQRLGCLYARKRIYTLPDTEYGGVLGEYGSGDDFVRTVYDLGDDVLCVPGTIQQKNELRHRLRAVQDSQMQKPQIKKGAPGWTPIFCVFRN